MEMFPKLFQVRITNFYDILTDLSYFEALLLVVCFLIWIFLHVLQIAIWQKVKGQVDLSQCVPVEIKKDQSLLEVIDVVRDPLLDEIFKIHC